MVTEREEYSQRVVIFREIVWCVQGHFALQQSCLSPAAELSWASRAPAGESGCRPVWKRQVLLFVTEQPPQRKYNTLAMVLFWHLFFGKSSWGVYTNAGGLIVRTDLPCWWQLNKLLLFVFLFSKLVGFCVEADLCFCPPLLPQLLWKGHLCPHNL